MKFQREIASIELYNEMFHLLEKHYDEIAHFKDIELSPEIERYIKLEEAGILRVFTNRKDDGTLIGYAVFFINTNLHYKNSLQATQDLLFINPNDRGQGGKFIVWCDQELKKDGVEVVYQHIKAAHNFGALLERIGYELVDLVYAHKLIG